MKGGRWSPFLRHYVVTVRCKIWVQRGVLQLRAYAPPSAPSLLGGALGSFALLGVATVSSKSEYERRRARALPKTKPGVGALLRGAVASNAQPGESDQH